jgi:GTP-binding protein HflX
VLEEIGAAGVPQLLVFNKSDLLDESQQPREAADWIEVHAGLRRRRVFVSAHNGSGLDLLRQSIAEAAIQARLNNGTSAPSDDVRFGTAAGDTDPTVPDWHEHA